MFKSNSVWGWLQPINDNFKPLELKKDKHTVGTDSHCSYVINSSHLKKDQLKSVAKEHFKITRQKQMVYLEDLSKDGTFIDGHRVSPGSKVELRHKSKIAVGNSSQNVFQFLDKKSCEEAASEFPDAVRNNYLISSELGSGGFGKVMLIYEKTTGKRFAMKIINRKQTSEKYTTTEKNILKKIKHPCVISIINDITTAKELYIIMEMMQGGDLRKLINSIKLIKEDQTKLIFFQLAKAIEYLHSQNIVHRDIKPENILLSTNDEETLIKVTDFGVSKILHSNTVMNTFVGTYGYMAPEILQHAAKPYTYTKNVDIWSMGVVLFYCLSGSQPFRREADYLEGFISFHSEVWQSISASAQDLVKRMLKVTVYERIALPAVLLHSWLKDEHMLRKAHSLMWPEQPYPEPKVTRTPHSQRKYSIGEEPRGVLRFMSKPSLSNLACLDMDFMPKAQKRQKPPAQRPISSPHMFNYNHEKKAIPEEETPVHNKGNVKNIAKIFESKK